MNELLDHVEFTGFEPDSRLRSFVCNALDAIMGSAPSDASPAAIVRRTGEGFEGTLRLISQQGVFAAKVLASTPAEATQRLNERIFEQIRNWRSSRTITAM